MRRKPNFFSDKKGAAAVEFALVSSFLILTILFVMTVGLILYFNQALDYATVKASRQVMIGTIQQQSVSQTNFRTNYVCPYLPAAFNCSNVIVNLQTTIKPTTINTTDGYYTFVNSNATALLLPILNNASTAYSPGGQGDYEYLQIIYPITFIPSVFASILGLNTYNGSPAFLAISTAAFRNEQY